MEQTIYNAPKEVKREILTNSDYLDVADKLPWATMTHYKLWFTGKMRRHRRSEVILPRLAKRGLLRTHLYGRKLIYSLPIKRKGLYQVKHDLNASECLVRLYRADTEGVVYPERSFKGLGVQPEGGITYENGKMLLLEYCTKSNFYYTREIAGKIGRYRKYSQKFLEKFRRQIVVLFVCDVPRPAVVSLAGSVGEPTSPPYSGDTFPEPFYFVDYERFLKVPIGEALKAPIYFWTDGKEYSLR